MRIITLQNKLKTNKLKLALLPSKGSKKQNTTYCSKDGNIWKHPENDDGEDFLEEKKKSQLDILVDDINKKNLNALALDNPVAFIRNHSGVAKLKNIADEEIRQKSRSMLVTVLYGTGGIGKSRYARDLAAKNGRIYTLMNPRTNSSVWMDNYDGQESLLMDDYCGYLLPHFLFRVLDIYGLQMEVKGSTIWANWNYVYITANKHPQDWYSPSVMAKLDFAAYFRRFHRIGKMSREDEGLVIRWEKYEDPVVPVDEPLGDIIQYGPAGDRILETETEGITF